MHASSVSDEFNLMVNFVLLKILGPKESFNTWENLFNKFSEY